MTSALPLAGRTVVEIGSSVAGPYAAMILGELGAEVIKVEAPAGDPARGWGPPFYDGASTAFAGFNRNKRSIVVDFADEAQLGALCRLILDRADVVVTNLRPGVAARFGLDTATLRGAKPALVYCEIGAFGGRGPLAGRPGYDPLMQAYSGLMSVTGEAEDRPPVRVGVSIIDMGSGLWSALAVVSALLERERTGRGGFVETSLLETAVAWMNLHISAYMGGGEPRRPQGSGLAEIVPYQAFPTADGWLMVAAGNDALFAKLAGVLGRPELAADPRYARNADRVVNRASLLPVVEAILVTRPRAAWREALDAVGVPNAPIQSTDQMVADPQVRALELIQEGPPGALATVGAPVRFDGARPPYRGGAPVLGEANALLGGGRTADPRSEGNR